ncbi:hypothetical protein EVAR_12987_1 [Eumeta japonica]|uniref:Uncharacterized protein n=1 Tax=Eumeta variegata TaxID=151549 RepID=A0A4C1TY45_EUMVA|nr:hypothetical protein EVAR_12987_1 [Eumeta japonica]
MPSYIEVSKRIKVSAPDHLSRFIYPTDGGISSHNLLSSDLTVMCQWLRVSSFGPEGEHINQLVSDVVTALVTPVVKCRSTLTALALKEADLLRVALVGRTERGSSAAADGRRTLEEEGIRGNSARTTASFQNHFPVKKYSSSTKTFCIYKTI